MIFGNKKNQFTKIALQLEILLQQFAVVKLKAEKRGSNSLLFSLKLNGVWCSKMRRLV